MSDDASIPVPNSMSKLRACMRCHCVMAEDQVSFYKACLIRFMAISNFLDLEFGPNLLSSKTMDVQIANFSRSLAGKSQSTQPRILKGNFKLKKMLIVQSCEHHEHRRKLGRKMARY